MSASDEVDAYDIVEEHFPYDGPYSPERTVAAALLIARLSRYLNNATQKPDALPWAATAGAVVRELADATALQRQLLDQLALFLYRQAADPTLYDDRRDRPGADTAREFIELLYAAEDARIGYEDALREASRAGSHLGNSE